MSADTNECTWWAEPLLLLANKQDPTRSTDTSQIIEKLHVRANLRAEWDSAYATNESGNYTHTHTHSHTHAHTQHTRTHTHTLTAHTHTLIHTHTHNKTLYTHTCHTRHTLHTQHTHSLKTHTAHKHAYIWYLICLQITNFAPSLHTFLQNSRVQTNLVTVTDVAMRYLCTQ